LVLCKEYNRNVLSDIWNVSGRFESEELTTDFYMAARRARG
jgi:hypothetical protein